MSSLVGAAAAELQSWRVFSCFVALFSHCLQTHRVTHSVLFWAPEPGDVLQPLYPVLSSLSNPLFPSLAPLSCPSAWLVPSCGLLGAGCGWGGSVGWAEEQGRGNNSCLSNSWCLSSWRVNIFMEFHVLKLCPCTRSARWDFCPQRWMV